MIFNSPSSALHLHLSTPLRTGPSCPQTQTISPFPPPLNMQAEPHSNTPHYGSTPTTPARLCDLCEAVLSRPRPRPNLLCFECSSSASYTKTVVLSALVHGWKSDVACDFGVTDTLSQPCPPPPQQCQGEHPCTWKSLHQI